MKKLLSQLIIGLTIGIFPALWILQNNVYIKKLTLESFVQTLEKDWNAKISIEDLQMNILRGRIFLSNITITSKAPIACTWHCESGTISVLKLKSLLKKRIELAIELYNNRVATEYSHGSFGIYSLLCNIFDSPSEHFYTGAMTIYNAHVTLTNSPNVPTCQLEGSLIIKKDSHDLWHGKVNVNNGFVSLNNTQVLQQISGKTEFDLEPGLSRRWKFNLHHHFSSPFIKENASCSISSTWTTPQAPLLILRHTQKAMRIFIKPSTTQILVEGTCAPQKIFSPEIFNFFSQKAAQQNLSAVPSGVFATKATITFAPKLQCKGTFLINDFTYNNISFQKFQGNFSYNKNCVQTNFTISPRANFDFDGKASWNFETSSGTLYLQNTNATLICSQIPISIPQKKLELQLTIDENFKSMGNYKLLLETGGTKEITSICGKFLVENFQLSTTGSAQPFTFSLQANLNKKLPLTTLILKKNNAAVAMIEQSKKTDGELHGTIKYSFLQHFLPNRVKKNIIGQRGVLSFISTPENLTHFTGNVALTNAKLYLAGTYNLISALTCSIDLNTEAQTFCANNVKIACYRGTVICPKLFLQWNTKNELVSIFAPIQLNNLFINWKNDFLGIINGTMFIEKQNPKSLLINGDISVKKSLFKENIFSQAKGSPMLLSSLWPFTQENNDIICDINITNEENLVVKTPFLKTELTTDLNIKMNTLHHALLVPQITGNITLHKGTLSFTHNKLFITSGKIDFIQNQINNPLIDLVAKNRIKKYLITLQATGTIEKPTIFLDSSPELSEEQIIALLFGGSENVSLSADLPALLMQNLHTLLLGSNDLLPKATNFFKTISKPLKYIQITPDFTDQTGRGGVRGTISIDVNKQLHAHIQKNFTMQDDLAFQVEYFLADDINLKAVKDARGDLGAEVELSFKP